MYTAYHNHLICSSYGHAWVTHVCRNKQFSLLTLKLWGVCLLWRPLVEEKWCQSNLWEIDHITLRDAVLQPLEFFISHPSHDVWETVVQWLLCWRGERSKRTRGGSGGRGGGEGRVDGGEGGVWEEMSEVEEKQGDKRGEDQHFTWLPPVELLWSIVMWRYCITGTVPV